MTNSDDLAPPPRWFGSAASPLKDDRGPADTAAPASSQPDPVLQPEPEEHDSAAAEPAESLVDTVRRTGAALAGAALLAPGPGLPYGRRARERKARRAAAAEETRRRRAALRREFDAGPQATWTSDRRRWRAVDRRTNQAVITGMVAVVVIVFAVALYLRHRSTPPVAPTGVAGAATTSTTPSTTALQPVTSRPASAAPGLSPLDPIPDGGVAPQTPATPARPRDPAAVPLADPPPGPPGPGELASPEAAMTAWLARWCTFTSAEAFGAAEGRAHPAMTAAGWAEFDPRSHPKTRASWDKTVAAAESGRCSTPVSLVSPEAPREPDRAIVAVSADRVITPAGAASYVETVADTRVVLRGGDGLWRVDVASAGG